MPTKTWKKHELSMRSIGATRNHFESEDCSHPLFSVECKHRASKGYPTTVRNWYEQARANAKDGKVALLVIHLANEIRGNDLVVMRRSDFEDLYGSVQSNQKVAENSHQTAQKETEGTDGGTPQENPATGLSR